MVLTESTRQRQPYLTAPAWQLKYIPKEHKKCSLVVYKYEWARFREYWVHFLSQSLYFDRMCTETQAAAIFEKWSFFLFLRLWFFEKVLGAPYMLKGYVWSDIVMNRNWMFSFDDFVREMRIKNFSKWLKPLLEFLIRIFKQHADVRIALGKF